MICSGCCGERDRPGQRYCSSCHAAYMRGWRVTTKVQDDITDALRDLMLWGTRRGQPVSAAVMRVGADLLALRDDADDLEARERTVLDVEFLRIVARQEWRAA